MRFKSTSFAFDIEKNIVVRRNAAESPDNNEGAAGAMHKDLLVIYRITKTTSLKAIYFDCEGHVINYHLLIPKPANFVIFESDALPGTPRCRLVHELRTDGSLANDFFIAPPGSEFLKYLRGSPKRPS